MVKIELNSRRWCDLIFEGRNRYYGAYAMRANAGRWYGRSLLVVFLLLLFSIALPFMAGRYVQLAIEKIAHAEVSDLSQLDPPVPKNDPALKVVATTAPPQLKAMKNAVRFAPQIAEEAEEEALIGLETELEPIETEMANETSLQEQKGEIEGIERKTPFSFSVEIVPEMPQFPGGLAAFMKWLDANLIYPESCRRQKLEGEVHVAFIVGVDGSISDLQVVRHSNRLFEQAALAVVRKMPNWTPGRVDGAPSPARIVIPIKFQLN